MKEGGGKKILLVGIACMIAYAEFGAVGLIAVGILMMLI